MSSGTVSVSGTGGIRNQNPTTTAPDPSKLALYITGNGAITWNTTRRFDGVIYATTSSAQPINVTNNGAVFYGALLSYNNIAFSGSIPAVHYDTKLRTAVFPSITTPFTIDTLSEVATQR